MKKTDSFSCYVFNILPYLRPFYKKVKSCNLFLITNYCRAVQSKLTHITHKPSEMEWEFRVVFKVIQHSAFMLIWQGACVTLCLMACMHIPVAMCLCVTVMCGCCMCPCIHELLFSLLPVCLIHCLIGVVCACVHVCLVAWWPGGLFACHSSDVFVISLSTRSKEEMRPLILASHLPADISCSLFADIRTGRGKLGHCIDHLQASVAVS